MLTSVVLRSKMKIRNMTHFERVTEMADWLLRIRLEKQLTQEQVANLIGIPRTTYSSIEQGRRQPSVKNAMRIASVLQFDWTLFFKNE